MTFAFLCSIQLRRISVLSALVLIFGMIHQDAQAQLSVRWLSVGKLHHPYVSGGAEPPAGNLNGTVGMHWPGIQPNTRHIQNMGLWISTLNWTSPEGENWPVKASHMGPRVTGIGEVFPVRHAIISKFEPPVVTVDGLDTYLRPVNVEEVNSELPADRAIETVFNTSVGVTVQRKPMQWSNEYHDSYHIVEYTFTNTGNVDDDDEIELPDQTLEDVFFVFLTHPTINADTGAGPNSAGGTHWGQFSMVDAIDTTYNNLGLDLRAHYVWMGRIQNKASDFNTIGNPLWYNHNGNLIKDDTLGRLGGAQMFGTAVVHADGQAHLPDEILPDDPAQPHTMTYVEWDWSAVTSNNDQNSLPDMQFQREWIERGSGDPTLGGNIAPPGSNPRTSPHQADVVTPPQPGETLEWSAARFARQTGDPSLGRAGGWGYTKAFGPYDMQPGQVVRIVVAEGVGGLSDEAKFRIGRAYKLSGANDELEIPFDANGDGQIDSNREIMTKNEWVMTTRDSLFQVFQRAILNYKSGYQIPAAPLPPSAFHVTSGTDRIELTWETYPGAADPPQGWEIWRAQKDYYGIPTALRVGSDGLAVPDSARVYQRIARLDPGERSYTDTNVERGLSYFYYIQAVGDVNNDNTALTPTGVHLKSSRYYTQTYQPAFLKRPPGGSLSAVRIVPNPYSLAADTDVRFGDKQDKIAFYGLPARATIEIYTERGELVDAVEHTDGSGDEFWDITTSSRQVVVSGIYLVVIRDNETGEQTIEKLVIIR